MPLESGSTISTLNKDWPLNTDFVLQGDDHIRLLKAVLLNQFQGSGGGLAAPVVSTAAEFNFLQGLTGNIQEQLNALAVGEFPSGTVMVFHQAAAPTGWTQITSGIDNKMLRVVTSLGGGIGGNDLVTNWGNHKHVGGNHTLLESQIPAHSHAVLPGGQTFEVNNSSGGFGNNLAGFAGGTNALSGEDTQATGGNEAHNHGDTVSSDFDPAFIDIIVATKD